MPAKTSFAVPNWIPDQNRFLTEQELKQLFRTTEQEKNKAMTLGYLSPVRDWFLIHLAATTGLRVQEMADLSCGDFQFDSARALVVVRKGKGGKKRLVHVRKQFRQTVQIFMNWKESDGESTDNDSPVFSFKNRRFKKRALQTSFQRSMKRAGIHRPRGVGRRSCTTELIRGGANMYHVKDLLGHESLDTLQPYTKLTILDLKKTHKKCHPRERDENSRR